MRCADRRHPKTQLGARDMAAAIPGATHLHQPDAGHMLLEERPQCVSDAIDSVLGMRTLSGQGAVS
jgi:pimeloyl-ACP methyl ester carboxylesterase